MIILIDNGHGVNTPGKCSPDKKHREYKWTRDFAVRLQQALKTKGYETALVTPETWDVPIRERCNRVNKICKERGNKNVLLISLHNNAAGGDGMWHNARGFSSHVSLNASNNSKRLATKIAQSMQTYGVAVRKPLPNQWYWTQNLGICRDTNCPAVLTENLFQDNNADVELLHNESFLAMLCNAHVEGIVKYINNK